MTDGYFAWDRTPGWGFRSDQYYDLFASYQETIAHCDSGWQWPGADRSHSCTLAPDHVEQFCRCDCGDEIIVLDRLRQPPGHADDAVDATALAMFQLRAMGIL